MWVNDIELEDLENYQARRAGLCPLRPGRPSRQIVRQPWRSHRGATGEADRGPGLACSWRRRWRPVSAEGLEAMAAEVAAEPPEAEQNGTTADHAHGAGARTGPPAKSRSTKK